jgi:hypothetical protein
MTPREKVLTFRPDADVHDAMQALRERDGVPFSEQIRRALRAWLEMKGVLKSDRKRALTRKRP